MSKNLSDTDNFVFYFLFFIRVSISERSLSKFHHNTIFKSYLKSHIAQNTKIFPGVESFWKRTISAEFRVNHYGSYCILDYMVLWLPNTHL